MLIDCSFLLNRFKVWNWFFHWSFVGKKRAFLKVQTDEEKKIVDAIWDEQQKNEYHFNC